MSDVDTAKTLTLIGAILSMVLGTIYLVLGVVFSVAAYIFGMIVGFPWMIGGILALIFGFLTLLIARKKIFEGDLRTGAILCFVFGGISAPAIGGILTIVAGILAIIAWNEQRKASEAPPSPLPPPPSV